MEYLVDRLASANEAQLVAIMYEGLIKKLEEAIENINNDDRLKLNESINKSRNIIAELIATLKGDSEIARNYKGLYMYLNKLITSANISKDIKLLEEAIEIVNPLYEGWSELGEKIFKKDIEVNSQENIVSEINKQSRIVTGMTYGKGYLNDNTTSTGSTFEA